MHKLSPDLSTSYLGLALKSPLIPSASPLSGDLYGLREMERCGAGAVVLQSLFEEPYNKNSGSPDLYVDEILRAKQHLHIPIIGSLNATTLKGWVDLARLIERAGADAVELNIYQLSLDPDLTSSEIEKNYVDITRAVTSAVTIPVAVKLPPFFTNLARITRDLEGAGAKGLVFFNRFYQPDLNLATMGPDRSLNLSTAKENRLPRHSISLLYRQTGIDLVASTGIVTGDDVLKMILAGASATQMCSILMRCGIGWLMTIMQQLLDCMIEHKIPSLTQACGRLSGPINTKPGEVEREEYAKALQGYSSIDVPTWHDEVPLKVF